jgi:hypothetical protein
VTLDTLKLNAGFFIQLRIYGIYKITTKCAEAHRISTDTQSAPLIDVHVASDFRQACDEQI